MQRFMILKIAFLMGVLFSTSYSADQVVSREGDIVTVIASGEYIMGDSDNRKEARTMALTQAKINASEVAGTYIESNFESVTRQINGEIVDKVTKQELRSFSAAILQSEITNDTMEMLANKTTIYKITIKARIDLAVLRERVKQLGEDKVKKDRLISLEKENKELSFTLEKLSAQIRTLGNVKSVNPEEIKVLREERDQLFSKFEKNEGATKLVFEKGSIQNEYQKRAARATEIGKVANDILVKHLSKWIDVDIEKPKIVSQVGNIFTLEVQYGWYFHEEKMIKMLYDNNIVAKSSFNGDTSKFSLDYNEMGFDAQRDKVNIKSTPSHKICIIFSSLNNSMKIPISRKIFQPSNDVLNQNLFGLIDNLRQKLTLTMSQAELDMFTEVTSRVVVDGECNEDI